MFLTQATEMFLYPFVPQGDSPLKRQSSCLTLIVGSFSPERQVFAILEQIQISKVLFKT